MDLLLSDACLHPCGVVAGSIDPRHLEHFKNPDEKVIKSRGVLLGLKTKFQFSYFLASFVTYSFLTDKQMVLLKPATVRIKVSHPVLLQGNKNASVESEKKVCPSASSF